MTDLKESMSRMLEGEPVAPFISDQIVADARRTQRRRRYVAGVAVMGGVAATVVGVAVATSSPPASHGPIQILTAASASPTPMATSTLGTTSGNVLTLVPNCPVGQVPNITVHHDQPVDPETALVAPTTEVIKPGSSHFLVDGGPPPAGSTWLLAWDGAGPANVSVLSVSGTSPSTPLGTSGFNATYVGCLPNPK